MAAAYPPGWVTRMTRLGAVISEAIVHHYGRDELLRRLAHPFWFQSFGAVMGMDWHSSGITTSVLGALKRGIDAALARAGRSCLRRARRSFAQDTGRNDRGGRSHGLDGEALAKASRLVAKVDSTAVQDGFDLYLHGFIVTDDGKWSSSSRDERRQPAGAPLSLALGRAHEFRRPASRRDRRRGARRRSSISRIAVPKHPARDNSTSSVARPRPHRPRIRQAGRAASCRSLPSQRCRIWSCPRITTCAKAMS